MLHHFFAPSRSFAVTISLCLAVSGCGGSNSTKGNVDKTKPGVTVEPSDRKARDARPDTVEEESKRLNGLWVLSRQEGRDGSVVGKGLTKGLLVEKDKVWDVYVQKGEVAGKGTSGSYKLDASKTPKTIDIRWDKKSENAVTELGIYKLEMKTLTISWSEPGEKERPKEFNPDKADIKYYNRVDRESKE